MTDKDDKFKDELQKNLANKLADEENAPEAFTVMVQNEEYVVKRRFADKNQAQKEADDLREINTNVQDNIHGEIKKPRLDMDDTTDWELLVDADGIKGKASDHPLAAKENQQEDIGYIDPTDHYDSDLDQPLQEHQKKSSNGKFILVGLIFIMAVSAAGAFYYFNNKSTSTITPPTVQTETPQSQPKQALTMEDNSIEVESVETEEPSQPTDNAPLDSEPDQIQPQVQPVDLETMALNDIKTTDANKKDDEIAWDHQKTPQEKDKLALLDNSGKEIRKEDLPKTQTRSEDDIASKQKPTEKTPIKKDIEAAPVHPIFFPYTLHVGSYKSKKNARKDVRNLTKKDQTAFISHVRIKNKGEWFRTFVGFYKSKKEASRALSAIKSTYKIHGTPLNTPYSIQLGPTGPQETLSDLYHMAEGKGFTPYFVPADDGDEKVRLLVGAFESEKGAENFQAVLTQKGLPVKMVRR